MGAIDTSAWTPVGETVNGRYYEVEPRILAVVPTDGSSDDATTAAANVAFHKRYFDERGRGVLLCFTDTGKSQDAGARAVYSSAMTPQVYCGAAYVGGSALTRAFATFIIAFARVRIPVKLFSTLAEALPWAHARLAEQESAKAEGTR